jgi:hypothetical protein
MLTSPALAGLRTLRGAQLASAFGHESRAVAEIDEIETARLALDFCMGSAASMGREAKDEGDG